MVAEVGETCSCWAAGRERLGGPRGVRNPQCGPWLSTEAGIRAGAGRARFWEGAQGFAPVEWPCWAAWGSGCVVGAHCQLPPPDRLWASGSASTPGSPLESRLHGAYGSGRRVLRAAGPRERGPAPAPGLPSAPAFRPRVAGPLMVWAPRSQGPLARPTAQALRSGFLIGSVCRFTQTTEEPAGPRAALSSGTRQGLLFVPSL